MLVEIGPVRGDKIRFHWSCERGVFQPYEVPSAFIDDVNARIRTALSRLVQHHDVPSDPTAQANSNLLDLASAGKELWLQIIGTYLPTPPERLQAWLANLDLFNTQIHCVIDETLSWPLHLADPTATQSYSPFGLNPEFTVAYNSMDPVVEYPRRELGQIRKLRLVDSSVLEKILPVATQEMPPRIVAGFYELEESTRVLDKAFPVVLEMEQRPVDLLYFLGHATPEHVTYGPSRRLSYSQIVCGLAPHVRRHRHHPIAIVNGCRTNAAQHEMGFGGALSHVRCSSILVTEILVPDVFGARFCEDLISQLASQGPEVDVVRTLAFLRVKHWPLSLAYALYAVPPGGRSAAARMTADAPNFSATMPIRST